MYKERKKRSIFISNVDTHKQVAFMSRMTRRKVFTSQFNIFKKFQQIIDHNLIQVINNEFKIKMVDNILEISYTGLIT